MHISFNAFEAWRQHGSEVDGKIQNWNEENKNKLTAVVAYLYNTQKRGEFLI